jgi:membrane-associated phospholipid phosphatase
MRNSILISVLGVAIASSGWYLWHHHESKTDTINNLRFSNTQTWSVAPYQFAPTTTPLIWSDFNLPPPPENTDAATREELQVLHDNIHLRTPDKLAEIEAELAFPTTQFGTATLADIFVTRPHTRQAFEYLIGVSDPVVLAAKRHFDRVRPSHLDPTLPTAIPVPNHPAYPSAHAVNGHLIAFLLSTLNPENTELYINAAIRIAHNREIAGVHYPSDSQAGAILASQLYQALESDFVFTNLLRQAMLEWE